MTMRIPARGRAWTAPLPGLLSFVSLALSACASGPAAPAPPARPAPRPAPPLSAVPGTVGAEADEDRAAETRPDPARPGEAAAPAGEARAGEPRLPVASVAGEPIDVRELLARWLHQDSPEVHAYLSHLVAARIARLEADRLGVVLEPAAVARRLAEVRGELERKVRATDPELTVERWLWTARGLDPARYFELARADVESQMLAERAVRAWLFAEGWARVRVIVVDGEDDVAEVRAELERGEPFADVARARSLDGSAEDGGLIAALVDSAHSPLSRLAFRTPVGEVGGPLEEEGRFLLLLVEELHEAAPGTWAELGERVEQSLAERPLDETEYRQWELAQAAVYGPDLTPFFELAGEPGL